MLALLAARLHRRGLAPGQARLRAGHGRRRLGGRDRVHRLVEQRPEAGTGIGYAAIPSLIIAFTPAAEIAAANGLNTLFRSLGSSLASAFGGAILAADSVILGSFAVPSLSAYRELFALCAGAAVLTALIVTMIPKAVPAD